METTVATEIGKIATSITGTMGDVAPLAMGVVAIFLGWRYGMRFFKSLSK